MINEPGVSEVPRNRRVKLPPRLRRTRSKLGRSRRLVNAWRRKPFLPRLKKKLMDGFGSWTSQWTTEKTKAKGVHGLWSNFLLSEYI